MNKLDYLKIAEITPDKNNPRQIFPDDEMEKLSESIDEVGVLVPVVVYKIGEHYQLLDGERRWRCAKELGLDEIPALIVDAPTEKDRLQQMFNIHLVREQWQDIPTAKALEKLMKETGVTKPSELSQLTGLTTEQINRLQFALDLTGEVRKKVDSGEVPLNYFYEVYRSVIRPLQKNRPTIAADYSEKAILKSFLSKRLSGAVPDIVSIRAAQYIIGKAAEDDPNRQHEGPLDKTIRQLLDDKTLSVTEAYEDTVMVSVEADKLEKRANGMVAAFERLLKHATNKAERNHVIKVGKGLIKKLRAIIS